MICRKQSILTALNLLVNAGIPTKTISNYAIHHDKYIVSDEKHVQTRSFNYSQAAAKSNSENVIVVWNNEAEHRPISSTGKIDIAKEVITNRRFDLMG